MKIGLYGLDIDARLDKLIAGENNTITQDEFCNALKGYRLDEALIYMAEISILLFDDKFKENEFWKKEMRGCIVHKTTGQLATEFVIAYIANLILICGSNEYKRLTLKNKDNILGLVAIYHNCIVEPPSEDTLISFLLPKHFSQFSTQIDIKDTLTRQSIIFSTVLNSNHSSNKIDLNKYLVYNMGISIDEYIKLTFIIFATVRQKPQFNINDLIHPEKLVLQSILNETKVNNILYLLSANAEEFRKMDKLYNAKLPPEYTKSRYNPLWQKPIIKLRKNNFIVPSISAYNKAAFSGLYWFFENQLKEKFTTYFGLLFEEYLGLLLKDMYGEKSVEKEIVYGNAQDSRKFFDWVVNDKGKCIFFESKAYKFPLSVLQTGDLDFIQKEIDKKVVQTIKQMYERVNDIKYYKDLNKFKNKNIVCVAVFYDIPFISTQMYQEYIELKLDKLNLTYSGIKDFKYYLISIDELENYQYIKNYISIEKVFERVKKNPKTNFNLEVNSIFKENKPDGQINKNLLDKKFNELFQTIINGS